MELPPFKEKNLAEQNITLLSGFVDIFTSSLSEKRHDF